MVTGANRGIGREVARQLALAGDLVVLTARDLRKAERAAGELREALKASGGAVRASGGAVRASGGAVSASGGAVEAWRLDVSEPGSVERFAREVGDAHGRVDVLVNNAAIHYDTWQRAADADLTVVREALETNLLGAWQVTQALLPLLRASAHGRVANVSSEAGSLASMGSGTPAYAVSKAGLNALTRMLAADLRRDGILVNAVCPGWVATDMGGPGGRPVAEGAASVLWAVDLPDGGPTGGFYRDGRPVPW
uniref:Probable short chain oxidoreductase n=1 Tax=Nonomuraea gerenzanensis TaxID=93944 RepID=A0A1M4DZW2_9ACTN|nr:probable short chain oxidoreductase [Nonomuraea gerenzanensis]